jgi:hypothetical protein
MNTRTPTVAAAALTAFCFVSHSAETTWSERLALLKQIRKTSEAVAAAPEKDRPTLQVKQKELQDRVAQLKKDMYGSDWTRYTFEMPGTRKDRSGNTVENVGRIWVSTNAPKIRGVFITLWGMLVHDPYLRAACREGGLAILCFEGGFDGSFNYTTGAGETFDNALIKAAEVTGHPELRGAPFISAGMSASVLGARNMAYWQPDRALGVLHTSGGNMHHALYDPKRTLAGVPFLAVNGEMEWCGPEGGGHMSGASGIRPEYGLQTQWVMMRESLIERQVKDPTHLMSMLVMPNANHGGWSDETACVSGLFMARAARYRLPGGYPDAKPSAGGCVRIAPKLGWLTDANLKAPQFKPAPYDKYEGDPARAFWHFDEELALATVAYHADVFTRPDPAWGPIDIEAVRAFNLSRSGGPDIALKELLSLCDSKEDLRRADAAGYIGRLGAAATDSIPRLIAMFGERPSPSLNSSVSTALARLAPQSTQALLDAAEHTDPHIRAGTMRTLGLIRQPADKILAAAETASAASEPAVRRAALDALLSMEADPARIGSAAMPVLDDLAASGEATVFSNACKEVIILGPNALAAAMPAIVRAVTNRNVFIFAAAVEGITAVRPKPPATVVPALGTIVLTDDTNRWTVAVEVIGKVGYADATNLVLACVTQLRNKESKKADLALELLGRVAAKCGTPEFRKETVRRLVETVEGKGDSEMRKRAARAIGAFGADAKSAVPALKMALDEPGLKDAAQKSLTDIGASGGPNLDADMP